jgi:hypothetical protein
MDSLLWNLPSILTETCPQNYRPFGILTANALLTSGLVDWMAVHRYPPLHGIITDKNLAADILRGIINQRQKAGDTIEILADEIRTRRLQHR